LDTSHSIFGSMPSTTDNDAKYELINTGESFDNWVLPLANSVEVNELKSYLDCEHDTLIVDYSPFNADVDYDKMVQETECFKQKCLMRQNKNQELLKSTSSSSSCSSAAGNISYTVNMPNSDLMYSQLNPTNQQLHYSGLKASNGLKATNSAPLYYGDDPIKSTISKSKHLGPIQRPTNFQFNNDLNAFNRQTHYNSVQNENDFKNNQLDLYFKLIGDDKALLSALISAKAQEIYEKNRATMSSSSDSFMQQTAFKQTVTKQRSADQTKFEEFRLFDNSSFTDKPGDNLFMENVYSGSAASGLSSTYWPQSSLSNNTMDYSVSTNNNQAWNSVLLNDFDTFSGPSSLSSSSTGNHIKSLWSNNSTNTPPDSNDLNRKMN